MPGMPGIPLPSAGGTVTWTIPLSVTVQLGPEIRVSLAGSEVLASSSSGVAGPLPGSGQTQTPPTPVQGAAATDDAVNRAREVLADRTEVLEVRGGFLWQDGRMTDREAIVVVVDPNAANTDTINPGDIQTALTTTPDLAGIPVDVTVGGASALLRAAQEPSRFANESRLIAELFQERVPEITYTPPTNVTLDEVKAAMQVTCHVSPDDGWPVLRAFLDRVKKTLTIGMYDLTAPHVVDKLKEIGHKPKVKINLAIQRGASGVGEGEKKHDIPEEIAIEDLRQIMKDRFRQAYVDVKDEDRTFGGYYHIKVAVRDGEEVWLSSGNMQSSNQPNIQPAADQESTLGPLKRFNREWHVVIRNKKLARIFEGFLLHDLKVAEENPAEADAPGPEVLVPEAAFEGDLDILEAGAQARYFSNKVFPSQASAPVRVQPLLTPDNYLDHVIPLIRSAQSKLFIQNQSLNLLHPAGKNEARFLELWNAIKERQLAGVDVRMIFRVIKIDEDAARATMERLVKFGLKRDSILVQEGCHTKGVIVDSKVLLLGSHNWTNGGVTVNRDASLIFWHPEMAQYYEQVFLFDWEALTRLPKPKAPTPGGTPGAHERLELAVPGLVTPTDRVRVRISDLLDG